MRLTVSLSLSNHLYSHPPTLSLLTLYIHLFKYAISSILHSGQCLQIFIFGSHRTQSSSCRGSLKVERNAAQISLLTWHSQSRYEDAQNCNLGAKTQMASALISASACASLVRSLNPELGNALNSCYDHVCISGCSYGSEEIFVAHRRNALSRTSL